MARQGRVRLITWLLFALVSSSAATVSAASRDRDGDGLRDAWEQRWGVTSARDADSDGDGLLDAAEDPDGDRLSNLGEQRFRTSPSRTDSDGDGLRDWREDSDRDGRRDGREQTAPISIGLRPSLSRAARDLAAAYGTGCHSGGHSRSVHPCVFGDPRGKVRITLFGDSHALQWLPALHRAAWPRDWRVTSITKSACPSVHVRYDDFGRRGPSELRCLALQGAHVDPQASTGPRDHRQLPGLPRDRCPRPASCQARSPRRVAQGTRPNPRRDARWRPAPGVGGRAQSGPARGFVPCAPQRGHVGLSAVTREVVGVPAGRGGTSRRRGERRHVPISRRSRLSVRSVPARGRQHPAVAR